MNENKFDLSNIITIDKVKDSYWYKKSEEALKKIFWCQFETEGGYNDENDEEMYYHVLLSYTEYNYLNDLCRLVNINIEDYSPMKYFLPNDDIRYITYSYCLYDLPDRYLNYADFKKLRQRVIKKLIERELIQFNLDKKTFWVTHEDYFKIISQLSCFIESYVSRKTEAINKLKNLFKRKAFYKINDVAQKKITTDKLKNFLGRLSKLKFLSDLRNTTDIVKKENAKNDLKSLFKRNVFHKINDLSQKKVAIDKLKNYVEHLAKLKFWSVLKNTAQTAKNTQAINKLDFVIKRNVFNKINNMRLKQKHIEQESQISIQEHDKNKKDNKQKKSLRKKLIIGSCITLILSLVILYFNLIASIISFSIGVCVLVVYGICKSKSNKIQGDPKILLKVPMNEQTTKPLGNDITKDDEVNVNNVPVLKGDAIPNLRDNPI